MDVHTSMQKNLEIEPIQYCRKTGKEPVIRAQYYLIVKYSLGHLKGKFRILDPVVGAELLQSHIIFSGHIASVSER